MKPILPSETNIEGSWTFNGKSVESDSNCRRIEWLIHNYLERLGADSSGWATLYIDKSDNRLWVLFYPSSEMQGGGPPALKFIDRDQASKQFGISCS